jgi:hypothetical protein
MTVKLEPLMTLQAKLDPPISIGNGPYGARNVFNVAGGSFEGNRLRGTLLPNGGDWQLLDVGGAGHLDVRITLATDDGARIYVQYYGVIVFNDRVNAALTHGGATDYGDTYFMTQPRFETGDSNYAWLNRIIAVAEGRILPGVVEYRVLEVIPS